MEFSLYPPSLVDLARVRGEVRLPRPGLEETVPPEQIADYPTCEVAAAGLDAAYNRATQQLIKAMGDPQAPLEEGRVVLASWHRSTREVQGQQEKVALAHRVSALTLKGSLHHGGYDLEQQSPLVITTHVIHRPKFGYPSGAQRFTGIMEGLVFFPEDAIQTVVKSPEIIPDDAESLEQAVKEQKRAEGRRAVWEKWVDEYLDLPHNAQEVGFACSFLGLPASNLRELFITPPQDREDAIKQLTAAFDPQSFKALNEILKQPVEKLNAELAESNNLVKMHWLLENATRIRAELAESVQHTIAFGFADAFKARITQEFQKVQKLEAIAQTLGRLTLITEYAPTS